MPPPWPCNKVLKPNFQFIISQANNSCSLLLLILAKPQLLDISCGNIFAVCIVTALTTCPFSIKKCAKMSVFYVKIVKIRWRLGATPPDLLGLQRLGVYPQVPGGVPLPPFAKSLGAPLVMAFVTFFFQSSAALGFKIFSNAALHAKSLPTPALSLSLSLVQVLINQT